MDVEALIAEGVARIESAPDSVALEQARVALLGRKAPLVLALRDVGSLPAEERGPQGCWPAPSWTSSCVATGWM